MTFRRLARYSAQNQTQCSEALNIYRTCCGPWSPSRGLSPNLASRFSSVGPPLPIGSGRTLSEPTSCQPPYGIFALEPADERELQPTLECPGPDQKALPESGVEVDAGHPANRPRFFLAHANHAMARPLCR